MDDLDLDRELRHALQVTPSPEFVARVRASIAEAPRPSIFASALRPTLAIVCAAVLAVAVGMWRQDARLKPSPTETRPAELSPAETAHTEAAPGGMLTAPPKPELRARQTFPASRAPAAPAPVEPTVPEVIIPPGDIEALQQFMASATELRFVASFEETPVPTPWVVTELTIPPLTITPLDPEPSMNN
jgi:hypothetical protein